MSDAPLIDMLTQLVDDRSDNVLLPRSREALSLVKDKTFLLRYGPAFFRIRYQGYELGSATLLDNLKRLLPLAVQISMAQRAL